MIKNNTSNEKCDKCNDQGDFYVIMDGLDLTVLINCDQCEKGSLKSES
jgi:hypothetical protein